MLLRSDSSLLKFTHSTNTGTFEFNSIPVGNFLLLFTDPSFAEKWEILKITEFANISLGDIFLFPRSSVLDTVIVSQSRPILNFKGDTLEYDALHVKTRVNANVEELLKQLPGITVDQKGTITVQGEQVAKILVDGEEFFSEDPTIATRNLPADMIAKVQVLRKKSARSEFTGIDDGKSIKTLNLVLREERKNGYFGKTEAGTNASQYYNTNALVGSFRSNQKISVFGLGSNTGSSSLAMKDAQSFDDGDEAYLTPALGDDDNFGNVNNSGGMPKDINAGMHYSNRWDGDGIHTGQHLYGNYRYNKNTNSASSYSFTQQIFPGTTYIQTQYLNSLSIKQQHALSGGFQFGIDSSSSFLVRVNGLTDEAHNLNISNDTTRLNNILTNSNHISTDAQINNRNMNQNILWLKRFARPGQTLTAFVTYQSSDRHVIGFLSSMNTYLRPDSSNLGNDTVDQKKDNHSFYRTISADISYTEAFGKNFSLSTAYGLGITNNLSIRNTWNKGNGKYENLVDSLSTKYAFAITVQHLNVVTQIHKKNFQYDIEGDLNYISYLQTNLLQNSSLHSHYINILPSISVRYIMNTNKFVDLNYHSSMQLPSIYQLQPIKNNNDPLNIVLGNPNLRPAFTHEFVTSISDYRHLEGKPLTAGISLSFTNNGITNKSLIDSLGRTVSQSQNVNGNKSASLFTTSSWELHSLKLQLDANVRIVYVHLVNFVNNINNYNNTYSPTASLRVFRNVPAKYYFGITAKFDYTYSLSSINTASLIHYFTQTYIAEWNYSLPWQYDFNTNANYTWRQRINSLDKMNQFLLWNVSLDKRFAMNKLSARLTINDILDQNKGLSNSITANQVIQTITSTIGRYWIASLIWNFSSRAQH